MKNTKQKPEKLNLQSMSITEEQKKKLRQLFPEVFNEKEIDWEKLKATLGEELDSGPERYNMNWPGKKDCFRIIQEPSLGTLKPCKEESLDWDKTQNLFIEGDNLEVLKLLQRSYYNKVKMIYIDPPYNTGKDFIYPDNYSETLNTYLQYTDQKDTSGKKFSTNQETDGRFHSKWINMMYPRLFLARNLLRDDGVIFISIDDNEVTNLRKICDEIFGEENFIVQIEWQKRYTRSNNTDNFTSVIDHIVGYQKTSKFQVNLIERDEKVNARFTNPDNDSRGPWKATPFLNQVPPEKRPNLCYSIQNPYTKVVVTPSTKAWRYEQNVYKTLLRENRLWWGVNKAKKIPDIKTFLSEVRQGMTPINFWDHKYAGHTDVANKEIKEIFGEKVFDTPKPTLLIKRMIEHICLKDDFIIDFFSGSSSTAHGILIKNAEDGGNRKFILVQLPEVLEKTSVAYKKGYKTITDIGKERIRRAVKKIKEENTQQSLLDQNKNNLDLGFKVFKLDKSNFKIWDEEVSKDTSTSEQVEMHLKDFVNPKSSEEDLLYEILIKTGFQLTTKIKTLKLDNKTVYSVEDNALLICLDKKITKELITKMAKLKPARVVCLDIGFENKDYLKTNAMETFTSHGVRDFKTV